MGRHWWGVCQLQGAVAAAIDLAEGRASTVKWRQNYDRKLQLIAATNASGRAVFKSEVDFVFTIQRQGFGFTS